MPHVYSTQYSSNSTHGRVKPQGKNIFFISTDVFYSLSPYVYIRTKQFEENYFSF